MSIGGHTTLADVILSREECVDQFGGLTYFILITSAIYFLMRTIKVFYNITQFLDIKKFYNAALNIDDVSKQKKKPSIIIENISIFLFIE